MVFFYTFSVNNVIRTLCSNKAEKVCQTLSSIIRFSIRYFVFCLVYLVPPHSKTQNKIWWASSMAGLLKTIECGLSEPISKASSMCLGGIHICTCDWVTLETCYYQVWTGPRWILDIFPVFDCSWDISQALFTCQFDIMGKEHQAFIKLVSTQQTELMLGTVRSTYCT